MNIAVYRCHGCGRAFTEWRVITGEGCGCGERKLSPTNPTHWEYVKLLPEVIKLLISGRRL